MLSIRSSLHPFNFITQSLSLQYFFLFLCCSVCCCLLILLIWSLGANITSIHIVPGWRSEPICNGGLKPAALNLIHEIELIVHRHAWSAASQPCKPCVGLQDDALIHPENFTQQHVLQLVLANLTQMLPGRDWLCGLF